jgi:hypothetical protein
MPLWAASRRGSGRRRLAVSGEPPHDCRSGTGKWGIPVQIFRKRRVLFEFLPPRSEQQRVATELDWQLFMLRRLALIRRKWRPVRVVPFGRRAAEVVQLWRDSPFEEAPLPTPLNSRSAGAELAGSAPLPSTSLQR